MLIRQPDYLSADYSDIKKKMFTDYTVNQSLWQTYWAQATIDCKLEAGDSSYMNQLSTWSFNDAASLYFNRVRPLLCSVSGYQRRNRKSSIVVPLENGDEETADQWTKILLGIYKRENFYDILSEAFYQGALVTGLNLIQVYLDFANDPVNGDVKYSNRAYNSILIDPYFRNADASDAAYIWTRSYMSHESAASIVPHDQIDYVLSLPGNASGLGNDGRFAYMPETTGYTGQNLLSYDEYWYRAYRDQDLLVDRKTLENKDVSGLDKDALDMVLAESNGRLKLVKRKIPTVKTAIAVQGHIIYNGNNLLNVDCYPFVPIIGYYNPMMPYFYSRIQGVVRSLRDPQMLLNRRITLSSKLLESQVNSGWKFKENAVIDVKHLFQTGEGRVIPIKAEAMMSDVEAIQPPQIPPSFFQLQETFANELNLVSGVTQENLGQIVDDGSASGYKTALKQGAGLTTLQPLFDRLDNAQNQIANITMQIVQNNFGIGKVRLLLEGQEPAPLFYDKAFGKYHATCELGYDTITQKQMQFAQYVELKKLGVNIPDEIMIDAAQIENKKQIKEYMMKQWQAQQQMQQQQAQLQMAQISAETKLAEARAVADQGLGYERMSRIQENQALAEERKAEANKDDYQALLNYAKAFKELENIDLGQIQTIFALKKMIENENQPQEAQGSPAPVDRGQPLSS